MVGFHLAGLVKPLPPPEPHVREGIHWTMKAAGPLSMLKRAIALPCRAGTYALAD